MKKVRRVRQEEKAEESTPKLKEIENDDEDIVRQVSFSMDF